MKNLSKKWGSFLGVILGPGSAIFILLTIGSLALAFFFKQNTLFATLLSVLGSVFAGVAGSFIKDDFAKLSSENVLEKKGRSAIRNLQSIGKQLANICGWISEFSKERVSKDQKRTLEEIDRHLSTARMNVEAGFADWVDIVPELAEEEEIERKTEETIKVYAEEWLKNQKALIESKDEKRTSEIKKYISDLEGHIKHIEQAQRQWASRNRLVHRPERYITERNRILKCELCGRYYPKSMMSPNNDGNVCPICKTGQDHETKK